MNALLLLASLLAADPELEAPPPTAAVVAPVQASGWYGQPAAVVDGASIAVFVGGAALTGRDGSSNASTSLVVLGALGFVVGGPLNHGINQHPGRAGASLGLRLIGTLAVVAILALHEANSCTDDNHQPGCDKLSLAGAAGAALPFVAVAALDDFLIARGTIPTRAPSPRSQTGPTVTPVVGPDWAMLAIGGRF